MKNLTAWLSVSAAVCASACFGPSTGGPEGGDVAPGNGDVQNGDVQNGGGANDGGDTQDGQADTPGSDEPDPRPTDTSSDSPDDGRFGACKRTEEAGCTPGAPGKHTQFSVYVMALSWAATWCEAHASHEQCNGKGSDYQQTHLTLHGLWPTYSTEEAKAYGSAYPEYCGSYSACESGSATCCKAAPSSIPLDFERIAPGYVTQRCSLANHEWQKHGSCTGLTDAEFFRTAEALMVQLPGEGTPASVSNAAGASISLAELKRGYPAGATFACDDECQLEQVFVCFSAGPDAAAGAAIECPASMQRRKYTNGCVVSECEQVLLPAFPR